MKGGLYQARQTADGQWGFRAPGGPVTGFATRIEVIRAAANAEMQSRYASQPKDSAEGSRAGYVPKGGQR